MPFCCITVLFSCIYHMQQSTKTHKNNALYKSIHKKYKTAPENNVKFMHFYMPRCEWHLFGSANCYKLSSLLLLFVAQVTYHKLRKLRIIFWFCVCAFKTLKAPFFFLIEKKSDWSQLILVKLCNNKRKNKVFSFLEKIIAHSNKFIFKCSENNCSLNTCLLLVKKI